ncbi:MAG: YdeI/OmpD-associated family protein, partial [Rhodothermales bacterium]
GPGDEVKVTVEEDLDPRVVKVPSDVKRLLKQHPEAGKFFEGLSYTHKKEYIQWIEEAKKPETRERRKEKMIEMLLDGRKERS